MNLLASAKKLLALPLEPGSARPLLQRRRRLTYAVASAALSKVTAVGLQLVAFPVALHALGTDLYAVFVALQSLLSWTSLLNLGLVPSLPKFIAGARAAGDTDSQRNFILWPLLFLFCVSAVLAVGLVLFGLIVPPYRLVAASPRVLPAAVLAGYFSVVIIASLQQLSSIEPAIRSGYQELHVTNLLSMTANAIAIALLLVAGSRLNSIPLYMMFMYLPLTLLFLLDVAGMIVRRPFLQIRPTALRGTMWALIRQSGNALSVQLAFFLTAYLPTLVVAHLTDPRSTAAFGTFMQMTVLGVASLNLIYQPLLSAISDARGHDDWPWIWRNYRRGLVLVLAIGAIAILALATAGPWIMTVWLHRDIGITRSLCFAFGCYFALLSLSIYHFYVFSGAGLMHGVGIVYVIQGVIAIVLGTLLCARFGALGMIAGLVCSLIAVSAWFGPLRMRSALAAYL